MFKISLQTKPIPQAFQEDLLWDVLIIGGGPAGLNAGLYAQRKGLKVGILTKEIGGQLHNTSLVDNYLGIPNILGGDLSNQFLKHIEALAVPVYQDVFVKDIKKERDIFNLTLDSGRLLRSKTVIYATGGQPRKLNIPGEEQYANKGVSYCTTCDAPFFKGKHVVVAGGGNSAAEAVIDLAAWASHITVIHRSQWRADQVTLNKFASIKNLTVHLQTVLLEVYGDTMMQGVKAKQLATGNVINIPADGLFIEIGLIPKSEGIAHLVKLNERNAVMVDENLMTSLPGLFAAGDVNHLAHKQIILAVADGARAALAAQHYIQHQ